MYFKAKQLINTSTAVAVIPIPIITRREDNACPVLCLTYEDGRRNGGIWHRRALHMPQELEIKIRGIWEAEKYDTLNDEICKLKACYQDQQTIIQFGMYGDDIVWLGQNS